MTLPGWLQRLRVSPPVNRLRYRLYKDVLLAWPRRHACNICGWRGRRLLTYLHRHVMCPQCGSQIRHRLIAAALRELPAIAAAVPLDGDVLHLSPEYCLGLVLRPRARRYIRGDYAAGDCDIKIDMTDMRAVASGSVDVLIACDTLEHIPDDRAALREVHRVLRPGGVAILTVPQADDDVATLEEPAIASPEERRAVYGQEDHVRNYGSDLPARIAACGFDVVEVDAASFPPDFRRRHVLVPPVPIEATYGWNRRRIHFATRRSGPS